MAVEAWGKLSLYKELKLLIGSLISCTLFDWFAINSGLRCIKDRGWRQPWSLWIPYTHLEGEGVGWGGWGHQYIVVSLAWDSRWYCRFQLLGLWGRVYGTIHFLNGKWWMIYPLKYRWEVCNPNLPVQLMWSYTLECTYWNKYFIL